MTLRTLSLVALAALSGCRIEKPSTVVPPAPTVVSFTASAPEVVRDGKVTLTWKTTDATSIELREATTGALSAPADRLEGSFEATITANALFVLTARGPGGSDARAVSVMLDASGAETVTFQALPPVIAGGASTTLVWSAPGATTLSLTAGGQAIDVRGQLASGAVSVSPRFDTTYTLTADGVSRTALVTVQPAVLTLAATPPAVEVGDTVTLSWTAAGADKLVITSPGRGQLAEITDAARIAAGTFDDVVPTLPSGGVVSYSVAATKGTASLSKSIEVFVGTGLSIVRLEAPPVASAGAPYAVRWQTIAAERVEVKLDGVVLHQTANVADALNGLFSFTAPASDFAVEIVATNSRGGRDTQLAQVDSVGVPTSATLIAAPAAVSAGTPVTLTYACAEARRVRITDGDGRAVFSVTGQLAEGGTVTVNPNADTTYTLTADNLLGSTPVTATAAVTVTGTPLTLVQYPPTAISGQSITVTASQTGALYTGFPHNQVLKSSQADFIDIKPTGTKVLETGSNVAQIDLPFAAWLWGTKQTGLLTISRAGWMAWGAPVVVNATETTLPSTSSSAAPFLIAPFWDDLTLTANSAVYAQLVGNAPDQSMVVQWDRLQVGTSTTTEVTFQARVHQNGIVSFHYKTMTLSSSTYSSFTAGVQDGTRRLARVSTGTPVSNSAVYFFAPVTSIDTRVVKGSKVGGIVEIGASKVLVTRTVTAVDVPADLAITEFMFRPSSALPNGQYLEVLNRTAAPLDLTGWSISATGSSPFNVADGFLLQPNVYTLVGASTDPVENDDAGVSLAWSPLSVSRDAGTLSFGNVDAGLALAYAGPADGGEGASIEFDTSFGGDGGLLVRSGVTSVTCSALNTFGSQTPLQRGSPGRGGSCFGYGVQSIPAAFVDITATGTRVFNSTSAVDGQTTSITLAATGTDPAPMAFGVRQPVVSVSSDGWLAWGTTSTTNFSNKTVPSSTTPVGVVAPWWDDLQTTLGTPTASDIYWKRFALNEDAATPAPHWVFMWNHFRHYNTSPADDLNFEVKLFENGTIEYHYGAMTSGTSSNYANGNSTTVWLEEPTGTLALPISVNQSTIIAPNTAWRFSPQ